MTQRQITQPLPTINASSSSTGLFLGAVQRPSVLRRSGLLHIPPPPIADRFPEVLPRTRDVVILGSIVTLIALYWFVTTPIVG